MINEILVFIGGLIVGVVIGINFVNYYIKNIKGWNNILSIPYKIETDNIEE